ncbi:MAG: biotin/lipoyl-binding protein, partial [Blastocatellia bacterium]|nr:biotin/lipoyl-binding protein [Blastocatellia bacterium]
MKSLLKSKLFIGVTIVLLLVVMLIALGRSNEKAAPPAAKPSEVEVVSVVQKDVPIYSEWIGTLDGLVNADIRAQVSGYLLSRKYTEGSFVRKGELLFEIDPRPFQAALDQAKGNLAQANGQLAQANAQLVQSQAQLAQAEANQVKAQLDVDRYTPLAQQNAITNQELDNAVQANLA